MLVRTTSVRAPLALCVREFLKVLYITSFGLKREKKSTHCLRGTDEEHQGLERHKKPCLVKINSKMFACLICLVNTMEKWFIIIR